MGLGSRQRVSVCAQLHVKGSLESLALHGTWGHAGRDKHGLQPSAGTACDMKVHVVLTLF